MIHKGLPQEENVISSDYHAYSGTSASGSVADIRALFPDACSVREPAAGATRSFGQEGLSSDDLRALSERQLLAKAACRRLGNELVLCGTKLPFSAVNLIAAIPR